MSYFDELQLARIISNAARIVGANSFVERRRPGRQDAVSPHLMPLLRQTLPAEPPPLDVSTRTSDRKSLSLLGVAYAVAISAVLWVGVGFLVWAVL